MARLVKLYDEKQLLVDLQADTLILIRDCHSIEPIKKFVECYDILRLTWDLQERYPREWPEDLECDEYALLHLKTLTQELFVFHRGELPNPGFDLFDVNVRKLLRAFRIPRKGLSHVTIEGGSQIAPEATVSDMSPVYVLDGWPSRPGPKE